MDAKIIVNVGLTDGSSVALVEYENAPDGQNGLMLPSTIVNPGEDVNGVAQTLLDETFGVTDTKLRIVDASSFVGHDGTWHVSLTYASAVAHIPQVRATPGIKRIVRADNLSLKTELIAHRNWTLGLVGICLKGDVEAG